MATVQDTFWIWGHDAGCHNIAYPCIPGVNRMGAVEGAQYLGIPNCCRVAFAGKPEPPFDAETERLRWFKQVVWSIVGDGSSTRNDNGGNDLEEVLRQAAKFPYVTGGILDDFFRPQTKDARMSVEELAAVAARLHAAPRPLSLWVVYYAMLFDVDYSPWLELVDVITFWSWTSQQLAAAETNLNRIVEMTPGKKHYAGCYLFNYGENKETTAEEMQTQLDLYLKLLRGGTIDGVVVCSNTVADSGVAAVEVFRSWMREHGGERLD